MIKRLFIYLVCFAATMPAHAQHHITINVAGLQEGIVQGQLKMGDAGPAGREIKVNNRYMTIGGKPVLPVMGEIHFSRYPRSEWQDVLLKMKACGINIISTYVFWIYHEEAEGVYDWSGNRDLRYFLKLCKDDGLMVIVRMGPWCHGEVRNGGLPDWLLQKKYIRVRSNDPVYQHYAQEWYRQIAQQLKGLLYKDGGPVIGVQLENEYRKGKKGEAHIRWLKQTALDAGIDVPLYTVTGWGNASVPPDEVIPLFGGYPGAPWNSDLKKITRNPSYVFTPARNDEGIGKDLAGESAAASGRLYPYPYFTCEIGIGNEVTYHRRPVFSDLDGLAIAMAKLGSGSNLIGYYMFAGGLNETGRFTSLEENQDGTGYPNRYPRISYDFQAAIRATGELSRAYYQLKKFHYFVNEFGSRLAPMAAVTGDSRDATTKLAYAVRARRDTGFIFGLNYYRGYKKPEQKQVQFTVRLPDGQITFPERPVDIADSCIFIWPFNFRMGNVLLRYATAQPLCKIKQPHSEDWFFVQTGNVSPELSFDTASIQTISGNSGRIKKEGGRYLVSGFRPGIQHYLKITGPDGSLQRVFILSTQESLKVWLWKQKDRKFLALSNANLYFEHRQLHIYGSEQEDSIVLLSSRYQLQDHVDELQPEASDMGRDSSGLFPAYHVTFKGKQLKAAVKPLKPLARAQWLSTADPPISPRNVLWHKFFVKEFSVRNTSEIRNATLYMGTGILCRIRLNHRWISQKVSDSGLNALDITGYLQEGNNMMLLEFPFRKNNSGFAARIKIDYFNTQQINICSDTSWLTTQAYVPPAPWQDFRDLQVPQAMAPGFSSGRMINTAFSSWELPMPAGFMDGVDNWLLRIRYTGNRATCRLQGKLLDDDFNKGTFWSLSLKRYADRLSGRSLIFTVYPLEKQDKIYADRPATEAGEPAIRSVVLVPQYAADLDVF